MSFVYKVLLENDLPQQMNNSIGRKKTEQHNTLFPLAINTIETIRGGSARFMIAEILLHPR